MATHMIDYQYGEQYRNNGVYNTPHLPDLMAVTMTSDV